MCKLFVNTDPILYESRSRSVRIHGLVTSVRLENLFWNVLAEIAAEEGVTTNQLIVMLYDEVMNVRGEMQNLASFLRVSCVRYLTMAQERAAEREDQRLGHSSSVVSLMKHRPHNNAQ